MLYTIVLANALLGAEPALPQDTKTAAPTADANLMTEDADAKAQRAALEAAAEAARRAAAAAQAAADALDKLDGRPLANAAPLATPVPTLSPWLFQVGLSLLSVSGNAEAFTGKFDGKVLGHWRDWNTEFRATAAYGQNRATDTRPTEITAHNAEVTARGERTYDIAGTYLLGAVGMNRVTSVAHRLTGEAGLSLVWWEDVRPDFVRSRLRTDLGFRVIREQRYQYYPTPSTVPNALKVNYGPLLRLNWRFALNKSAFFTEEADVMQDIPDERDLRFNTTTAVTAQLYESLAFTLSFKLSYVGSPPAGKQKQDTELASGVTFTW